MEKFQIWALDECGSEVRVGNDFDTREQAWEWLDDHSWMYPEITRVRVELKPY